MRRILLTILFLVSFSFAGLAQDRTNLEIQIRENRFGWTTATDDKTAVVFRLLTQTEPQLLEYPNLGFAAGMAQSPQGYPVILSDVVPTGSIVSIWGKQLSGSSVAYVLLLNQGREWALKAEVYPQLWFGLETCVFRLPSEIHGEVFIKAIGESRNSNKVRILVE